MCKYFVFVGVVILSMTGCERKGTVGNACQGIDCGPNGTCVLNQSGSAECDCDEGYYAEGLTCVESLEPVCGNGIAEGDEVCDGEDLRGVTCEALGFDGGELGCSEDCTQFDLSGCMTGDCGNGVADPGEICDGDDLRGHTCESLGFESGTLGCLPDCSYFDTSGCDTYCGDGLAGGNEECDGDDFRGQTCESLGYHGGELACVQTTCMYDLTSCEGAGRCGDGVLQADYEVCDGDDLGGETCMSQGFYSGTLACLDDCSGFDLSGCTGVCGDGVLQADYEVCDGDDLGGETCMSQGFYSGTLACLDDCSDFDLSGCTGVCGDGVKNGPEVCDGDDLGGETCMSQGFYSGTLACLADCSGFNLSGCSGFCGDGVKNGPEVCDGGDLGGETCMSQGFSSGTLACRDDCSGFDFSGCEVVQNGDFSSGLESWTITDVSETANVCTNAYGEASVDEGRLHLHGHEAWGGVWAEQWFSPVRPGSLSVEFELATSSNCSNLGITLLGDEEVVFEFTRSSGWYPPYGDDHGLQNVRALKSMFEPHPGTCVVDSGDDHFQDIFCANNTGSGYSCYDAGRPCQPRSGLLEFVFDWTALTATVTVNGELTGIYNILDPDMVIDGVRMRAHHGCCDSRRDVHAYFDNLSILPATP